MNAIKTARKRMSIQPESEDSKIVSALVLALESDQQFELSGLYRLSMENFELALEVLREWRMDRYYVGKAKLFDLSHQIHSLDRVSTHH